MTINCPRCGGTFSDLEGDSNQVLDFCERCLDEMAERDREEQTGVNDEE